MGRTKNITYIQTPISMTLPNGKVKYFSNSRKAQTFFDKYYANQNKEMLIGSTKKQSKQNTSKKTKPQKQEAYIENKDLPEVEVVAPYIDHTETDQNMFHRANVEAEDRRVSRSSNFGGAMNITSPGMWLGAIINANQGEGSFVDNLLDGNSGYFTDNFARNNPRTAMLGNMLIDGLLFHTINQIPKGYRSMNTYHQIGSGGESIVYRKRNPFTTHIIKESTIPPEEMQLRNNTPRMVSSEYLGTTEDGLYRYKQPRMFFPKKTSNILRNIAEDLVNKGWFPSEYPNLQGYAFFNPEKGLVLNDLGETGYGQVGRLWFGKSGIGDALVQPIPEFVMDMKKCGGRLIQKPNYLKKLQFGGLLGVFASYVPTEISTIKKSYRLQDMIPQESMDFIGMDQIDTQNQKPLVIKVQSPNKKIVQNDEEDILETIESQETQQQQIAAPSYSVLGLTDKQVNELMRMDIEDLLRQEKITSINGKPIKFGNKGLRPANATFGAKYSNHKKRDPYTGNAMARDISIVGGTYKDYADFRAKLLSNPRVVQYMAVRGWGIINELTSQALKKTRGTGPHFHFGPDTWAKRTWQAWLNNPNVSVTKLF